MNIFGIKILTPKTLAAMIDEITASVKATEEEEVDDPSILESAKFARVYNKGTAKEMLNTIRLNARDAERNSMIALYLSIPHQMGFLLGSVPLVFGSLGQALGSVTLLGMAIGLPYLCDRAILMCIRNISTRVVSTWDKFKAFGVLIPCIAMSIFLNIAAPGPQLLKLVCGAVVAMVPLYQIIRSVRPNFKKAGADEVKIRDEVEGLASAKPRAVRAQVSQAKAQKAKNSERGKKAWETRRIRAEQAAQAAAALAEAEAQAATKKTRSRKKTPVQQIEDLTSDAPVSPAIVINT